MSEPLATYLLLSLPESAATYSSALSEWLSKHVNGGRVDVVPFEVPSFKVGTLDSLVQQSEELSKYDNQLSGSIGKILDIITSIFDGNEAAARSAKVVDGKPILSYVEKFKWNTSKYRLDKPIKDLIETITTEAVNLDNDVRSAYTSYNTAKSNLVAAQRKKTGDLSVRSLHDIVKESDFVLGSEHLVTLLVAVPKSLESTFLEKYETLTEFVVPRSASVIASDGEFVLYNVTLFKKFAPAFVAAAREQKWTPREFDYSEETISSMKDEFTTASHAEQTLRNDLIRLTKAAYSEIVQSSFHIKALRTFVESVLRYGLPPNFYSFLLNLPEKAIAKSKEELIAKYGYLGGNAFSTDKKGRVLKDSSLHEYASLVDTEYEPFVLYEVKVI
ncbi:unnamed protein product [Kuraishia capsulata CBS 1993]|uniref:V-type proton ATPase subunit C n=1 Tax=Kuraishia capsulata CBS 1993 TaxID=1382522 RepID=W6MWJ0_9ASCO|nr:uncharacterized protein KUCA_T00003488001 [Kuraishia capsulata CBS 1993]CDK27510.1 unnamed protein product [Kuraishia capsulata CBS 1993]